MIRCTIGRCRNELEDEVSREVVGEVGLGGHEDDDDGRRDPEDESTPEQVSQIAFLKWERSTIESQIEFVKL